MVEEGEKVVEGIRRFSEEMCALLSWHPVLTP
jgi:hypothetical protein